VILEKKLLHQLIILQTTCGKIITFQGDFREKLYTSTNNVTNM